MGRRPKICRCKPKPLGSGGNGYIYKVNYLGKPAALKYCFSERKSEVEAYDLIQGMGNVIQLTTSWGQDKYGARLENYFPQGFCSKCESVTKKDCTRECGTSGEFTDVIQYPQGGRCQFLIL